MVADRAVMAAVALASFATMDALAQSHADSGQLHVRITGFETDDGALAVALFANEADYENQDHAVRRAWLEVTGDEVEWIVEALPPGEYAAVAYHDINGNRKLDFRLFGMPKEPVGVSNNARGAFGPPGFDAAKFSVKANDITRQHLQLR